MSKSLEDELREWSSRVGSKRAWEAVDAAIKNMERQGRELFVRRKPSGGKRRKKKNPRQMNATKGKYGTKR